MDSYTRAAINAPRGPHKPAPAILRGLGLALILAATAYHWIFEVGGMIATVARAFGA